MVRAAAQSCAIAWPPRSGSLQRLSHVKTRRRQWDHCLERFENSSHPNDARIPRPLSKRSWNLPQATARRLRPSPRGRYPQSMCPKQDIGRWYQSWSRRAAWIPGLVSLLSPVGRCQRMRHRASAPAPPSPSEKEGKTWISPSSPTRDLRCKRLMAHEAR